MTQKRNRNGQRGNGVPHLPGLSRGSTYRLSPELSFKMELHALATSREKKDILEEALSAHFSRYPIPKKLREAAETILKERWKE